MNKMHYGRLHPPELLMCEMTQIQHAHIQELCRTIISGQQAEIEQIKTILNTLQK